VLRVGLTGGIGSGKSSVARLLAQRGAVVVDSDTLAREVVAPGTPGLAEVVIAFGPDVVQPDGTLDRRELARHVFGDPAAKLRLEAIVHPRVRTRAAQAEAAAPPDAVVVHDIPLLVETGQADRFDTLVVVDCPTDVQLQRLVDQRRMSRDEAQSRIQAQATRDERLAVADHVIDNSGSEQQLATAVDELWQSLSRLASTKDGI
jgi:dephospho-CoA kinase